MPCTCSKAAHCGLVPRRQFQDSCAASGHKSQSDLGVGSSPIRVSILRSGAFQLSQLRMAQTWKRIERFLATEFLLTRLAFAGCSYHALLTKHTSLLASQTPSLHAVHPTKCGNFIRPKHARSHEGQGTRRTSSSQHLLDLFIHLRQSGSKSFQL